MKSFATFLIAAAVSADLCCSTEWGDVACTTDLARDGSHPVKIEGNKKTGFTAIVRNHPGIRDGDYKCESISPIGEKVF